jgi:5-methylcytosine-specific restriction protein B
VPALLQSQAYIVDLTEAYEQLAALVPRGPAPESLTVIPEPPGRPLGLNRVTLDFAERLLMDQAELVKIADLLWERKQIILYGPPGTGKTYLARELARHLTDDGAVKLVQFHPSYTYEDFFEGFRPEPGGSGTLTFTLRAGPFRDFAEVATANPTTAYILIIDEINRANLAKVFGELYFLLEYRDQSISLQYSPGNEFTLPQNLFLIGTMNTADRSVALIDAAMRRRFHFVPFFPHDGPMKELLRRWLADGGGRAGVADFLDAVNNELLGLVGEHLLIGPSHFMKTDLSDRALGRIWTYNVFPLIEEQFWGNREEIARWRWASVRERFARALAGSPPPGSAESTPQGLADDQLKPS